MWSLLCSTFQSSTKPITPIPAREIDITILDEFNGLIQNTNLCIKNNKIKQAEEQASVAIDYLHQFQLLSLLDTRAYSRSMQGHFELACGDAKKMIECAPQLGDGYIRLGNIFSMYGYQETAIRTFDVGLKHVKGLWGLRREEVNRLKSGKSDAIKMKKMCVDIIARVPVEIADRILELLSTHEKVPCLRVSKVWRRKLFDCKEAWRNLVVYDTSSDTELAGSAQQFAGHVEHLTLNTSNIQVRSKYLKHIRSADFYRVESLEIPNVYPIECERHNVLSLSNALWQLRYILTTLSINVGNNRTAITIAELVSFTDSLKTLNFSTMCNLTTLAGDFSKVDKDHPLMTLEIRANRIHDQDIEKLLQQCQQLRRLVMNGCDECVFNPLNHVSHNLSILACNYEGNDVPEIKQRKTKNDNGTGLKMIYTGRLNSSNNPISGAAIFPLLHKNMKSLETIHCYLSDWSTYERQIQLAIYPGFKLEKLITLKTSWPRNTLFPLLLQQIAGVETLTTLSVANVCSAKKLVNLIMNLRTPPKVLELHKIIDGSLTENTISYIRLIELGVTDSVLSCLGQIRSLNNITFSRLQVITNDGILRFISTCSGKLSRVTFVEMYSVTNEIIIALGRFNRMSYLGLKSLRNVTDQGIRGLIEEKVAFKLVELSTLIMTGHN
ncbi:hypothetical protein INT45_006715 [Circinella minor]|uniref:F-box domain-containing protein n=1 Tax=Circinella minor TaxID=1195481 RepID=A0A8H7S4H5_9FUNG|nr:hypothetical protein INT45_006715 [Circinella minor]